MTKVNQITRIPGGELLILAEHIAKQRRTDDVYRRLLTVSVSGTCIVPTALLSLVECTIEFRISHKSTLPFEATG